MSVSTELESGVRALFHLSEAQLEGELGIRLVKTADEVARNKVLTAVHATAPTQDQSELQTIPEFARVAADRFLKRFNKQMYSLICDDSDPDHDVIRTAALQGGEALGFAISGALVATFGWLPGIATVIAVIIAKRAAKAGHHAFCETWRERILV